ncbi:MAG TPA: SpoIIE family protein phosphatase [Thermoanaerobaculia bacterium]|nr:SpoIIE family protein phosphatase [Thermoanaerobaculia bacterium]
MKLRTQLALSFLVLAVLPLGGIVLYSYASSLEAFHQAVAAESQTLTAEMEQSLGSTRERLKRTVRRLGELPPDAMAALRLEDGRLSDAGLRYLAGKIGEDLRYVESLEFIPEAVEPVVAAPPPSPGPGSAVVFVMPSPLDPQRQAEIAARVQERLARTVEVRKRLSDAERQALEKSREQTRRLLGEELKCTVRHQEKVLGNLRAQVKPQVLVQSVLASIPRSQGEVPFAVDPEGRLYLLPGDERRLQGLSRDGLVGRVAGEAADEGWLVVDRHDPETGLRFGVARPVRESLQQMRRAAARNFGYGLGLVGLSLVGIFPLSGRISRKLSVLSAGADRLAQGRLETRVPVGPRDELGRLAEAFNHMAEELSTREQQLLEQERLRKEQEIDRRLLEAEHSRKSAELEQARQFQLSLLPARLPEVPGLALAASVHTATEVGGDYYDFLQGPDGSLTVAVGDATGHGAASGILVTAVKGLFTADVGWCSPAKFLDRTNNVIRRMRLGRMAMALAVLRLEGRRLTVASAGMPPVLLHRAVSGTVEEILLAGTPLGALADCCYSECEVEVAPGDTLLLLSDGFPELAGPAGEPLGYPRAQELFGQAAGKPGATPDQILADLIAAGDAWRGGESLGDDMTFVVLKVEP